MKFSGVTILQGVEFSIFPIDFTALPVIITTATLVRVHNKAINLLTQQRKWNSVAGVENISWQWQGERLPQAVSVPAQN